MTRQCLFCHSSLSSPRHPLCGPALACLSMAWNTFSGCPWGPRLHLGFPRPFQEQETLAPPLLSPCSGSLSSTALIGPGRANLLPVFLHPRQLPRGGDSVWCVERRTGFERDYRRARPLGSGGAASRAPSTWMGAQGQARPSSVEQRTPEDVRATRCWPVHRASELPAARLVPRVSALSSLKWGLWPHPTQMG